MIRFRLKVNQQELNLIVQHLNKGVYADVAQLLNDLHGQVQTQLPKPKGVRTAERAALTPKIPHTNGSSHYAKGP